MKKDKDMPIGKLTRIKDTLPKPEQLKPVELTWMQCLIPVCGSCAIYMIKSQQMLVATTHTVAKVFGKKAGANRRKDEVQRYHDSGHLPEVAEQIKQESIARGIGLL